MSATYAFRESAVAAERLALVADAHGRVVVVAPDPVVVAGMFALNLRAWRDEIDATIARELERGLREPQRGAITWRLRQVLQEVAR